MRKPDVRERLPLLHEALVLALREARRRLGLSQRARAEALGWSKGQQARLEVDPGRCKLSDVERALQGSGWTLVLVQDEPAARPLLYAVLRGQPVSELLARDRAGRRFPATARVQRAVTTPRWWVWRHSTYPAVPWPEWTADRWAWRRHADRCGQDRAEGP